MKKEKSKKGHASTVPPTGRQCASRILGPESSYCPRHCASQPPGSQNFTALLTENACDFQDPQGINHSLAALDTLLASGRISPRRATGLAYIASLLLRTLPAISNQLAGKEPQFEIFVPPRGSFQISRPKVPAIPEETTTPEKDDPQGPTMLPNNLQRQLACLGRLSYQRSHPRTLRGYPK